MLDEEAQREVRRRKAAGEPPFQEGDQVIFRYPHGMVADPGLLTQQEPPELDGTEPANNEEPLPLPDFGFPVPAQVPVSAGDAQWATVHMDQWPGEEPKLVADYNNNKRVCRHPDQWVMVRPRVRR